jgi:hypothetical protein
VLFVVNSSNCQGGLFVVVVVVVSVIFNQHKKCWIEFMPPRASPSYFGVRGKTYHFLSNMKCAFFFIKIISPRCFFVVAAAG